MSLKELLQDMASTGPNHVKKLMSMADNIPSEETLQRLTESLASLVPFLPTLERFLNDGGLTRLEALSKTMPDAVTLTRLTNLLDKIPDAEVLKDLLTKVDKLEGFIDGLDLK